MAKRESNTIAMTFRVGESRASALRRAIERLPYHTSQSALIDRAIAYARHAKQPDDAEQAQPHQQRAVSQRVA